LVQAKGQ